MPTKEVTLNHAKGCPEKRTETYTQSAPRNNPPVTITRCIDCGAHEVHNPKE